MKLQMMTLSQLPLFLRFSVRMLCLQVFFIAVFISSQTPFSYSDSTIFVSEDSYLYVESPVDVSSTTFLSGRCLASSKQFNAIKRKTFFKLKTSFVSKSQVNQINQLSFTVPKSPDYIVKSTNPLSTAVLGNSSSLKQHQKILIPILKLFLYVNLTEKKFLYSIINYFNLLKIIINYFSRPPPMFAIIMKHFIKHK